jgi:TRAP-type transport system small permease protein
MSLPVGAALLIVTTALKVRGELRGERAEYRAVDVI